MPDFASLPVRQPLDRTMTLVQSDSHAELSDPASAIFTDLRIAPSVVVPAAEPLADSLRLMQLAGVRMAFVVDVPGSVIGLVTAADLHGERPMVAARSRGVAHEELSVADVMTSVSNWPTVDATSLPRARVGDVVATFQASGQRYLIVTEAAGAAGRADAAVNRTVVRGLFSANRAERALGHSIDQELRSRNVSELAAALAHR
jgi:CBS domain-containing protein